MTGSADVTVEIGPAAIAAGIDGGNELKVFDTSEAVKFDFAPYAADYTSGVRVAMGDVTGDGVSGTLLQDFVVPFDSNTNPNFTGGIYVAAGDVNGDGFTDIIVGADVGGAPEVAVFSGKDYGLPSNNLLYDFLAYDASVTAGVRVAVGDLNGNGFADIITGTGAGTAANIRAFGGRTLSGAQLLDFMTYSGFTGGVYVAAAAVDSSGKADIFTGPGPGSLGPQVQVLDNNQIVVASGLAYDSTFTGGVRVGAVDLNGTGQAAWLTGAGPSGAPQVHVLNGVSLTELDNFFAFASTSTSGVFMAGA